MCLKMWTSLGGTDFEETVMFHKSLGAKCQLRYSILNHNELLKWLCFEICMLNQTKLCVIKGPCGTKLDFCIQNCNYCCAMKSCIGVCLESRAVRVTPHPPPPTPDFYFFTDRIFYGCIDFFLILKMFFYGFLNRLWVFKNLQKLNQWSQGPSILGF